MNKKLIAIVGLFLAFIPAAFAGTTSLSGTSGAYTLGGTDTYGFSGMFVKVANFMSDNGLNKIIGVAGAIGAIFLANQRQYAPAVVTAIIAMFAAFLPQTVDALYGAMI